MECLECGRGHCICQSTKSEGEQAIQILQRLTGGLWIERAAEENDRVAGILREAREFISARRAPAPSREADQARRERENAEFAEWWGREQACPEHSLVTENAAHAAWQERGRRAALARAPLPGQQAQSNGGTDE